MEFWKTKFFQGTPLPYLPLEHTMKDRTFLISRLKVAEVPAVYDIVNQMRDNDDNIGVDEFPDLDNFILYMSLSEGFSVREGGELVGAIFAGNRERARSRDTVLCECDIFLRHELFRGGFHRECVLLAERFMRDMKLGYFMSSLMVFEANWEIMMDLRRIGYTQCLSMPRDGKLKKLGLQQTWMLVKQIDEYREVRPLSEIKALLESPHYHVEADMNPPTHEALPIDMYLRSAGMFATLRWITPKEYRPIYEMFQEAMAGGEGYAIDEMLTYEEYLHFLINERYSAILEERGTGRILGFFTVAEKHGFKGRMPTVSENSALINPAIRSGGIGSEMVVTWRSLLKYMGFEYMLPDTILLNRRMRQIESKGDTIALGVIPWGVYVPKQGWVDTIYTLEDVRKAPHFPDLVQKHKERIAAANTKQKL